MALDPRIALLTKVPSVAEGINIFDRTQELQRRRSSTESLNKLRQKRGTLTDLAIAQQPLETEQLELETEGKRLQNQQRRLENLSERDKFRFRSLVRGAINVAPAIEAGDLQGAEQQLQSRIQRLEAEGVDTSDSRELLGMIQSGNIEGARRIIDLTLQGGERLGFLEPQQQTEFGKPVAGVDAQGNPVFFQTSPTGEFRTVPGVQPPPEEAETPPGQDIKTVAGLRKEWTSVSKEFRDISNSFQRVNVAANNPSPAGDLALIFSFMKMLDPTSVVREGEQATASNAAGVPDQIRNQYNRLVSGERLTPEQRADFANQAKNVFNVVQAGHERLRQQFGQILQRQGVNPQDVLLNFQPQDGQQQGNGFAQMSDAELQQAAQGDLSRFSRDELTALSNELRSRGL